MIEKKINLSDAYSLKTPEDSIDLYKKWAQTYDEDFAVSSNYRSPKEISNFFNKYSKNTDTPILDVGAGTGLVGEILNSRREIVKNWYDNDRVQTSFKTVSKEVK